MLSHASLSKVFWGETLLITNYLQNQSPTKVVPNNITLYEIWFDHKPILSHLQILVTRLMPLSININIKNWIFIQLNLYFLDIQKNPRLIG
jgi:hypothetical protein